MGNVAIFNFSEENLTKLVRDNVREQLRACGVKVTDEFPQITKRVFSIREAEKYTGWSSSFLYELEDAGLLKFSRVKGKTSVLVEDLDQLLEDGKNAPPRDRMKAVKASAAARRKQSDGGAPSNPLS